MEYRWAGGQLDRLPALAVELASRGVDVIIATGGLQALRAAIGYEHHPDRVQHRRRSGEAGTRFEPRSAEWQCHGHHRLQRIVDGKAIGFSATSCPKPGSSACLSTRPLLRRAIRSRTRKKPRVRWASRFGF